MTLLTPPILAFYPHKPPVPLTVRLWSSDQQWEFCAHIMCPLLVVGFELYENVHPCNGHDEAVGKYP